jgi:hypothetical protein
MARWRSWSGSHLPKHDSALLHRSWKDYDLLFDISNSSRAGTPASKPCPPSARSASGDPAHGAMPRHPHPRPRRSSSPNHPRIASKHITAGFQTGSLQVAVSKTVRRSASHLTCAASRRTVSDTALGLRGNIARLVAAGSESKLFEERTSRRSPHQHHALSVNLNSARPASWSAHPPHRSERFHNPISWVGRKRKDHY